MNPVNPDSTIVDIHNRWLNIFSRQQVVEKSIHVLDKVKEIISLHCGNSAQSWEMMTNYRITDNSNNDIGIRYISYFENYGMFVITLLNGMNKCCTYAIRNGDMQTLIDPLLNPLLNPNNY